MTASRVAVAFLAVVGLGTLAALATCEGQDAIPFETSGVVYRAKIAIGEPPGTERNSPRRAPLERHAKPRSVSGGGETRIAPVAIATFRVRVVDGDSGTPIPGAQIWFLEHEPRDVLGRRESHSGVDGFANGLAGVIERFGTLASTGLDGTATIPLLAWGRRCVARHGEHHGELDPATQADADGCYELRVRADSSLKILVQDRSGTPVVGVGVQLDWAAQPFGGQGSIPVTHGRTRPPAGTLMLRSLPRLSRNWPTGTDGRRTTRVRLEVLGFDDPGVPLQIDHPASQTIRLTMPATGSIAVEVRNVDGGMIGDGYSVELSAATSAARSRLSRVLRRQVQMGRAVFSHITLGGEWRAVVRHRSRTFEHVFRGPAASGEILRTEFRMDIEDRVFTGRALSASGAPLANTGLVITLLDDESTPCGSARGRTDTDGRFRLDLDCDNPVVARTIHCRASDGLEHTQALESLHIGEIAVGDLRFRASRHLLAGQILDERGQPIRGASGRIESRIEESWRDTGMVFKSDRGGRFEISGERPKGDLRLRVSATGYAAPAPIAITGDHAMPIRLARAGSLRVAIRLGDQIRATSVSSRLSASHELTAVVGDAPRTERTRDGLIHSWAALRPGSYRLEIRETKDATKLIASRAISIEPATRTRTTVDLRTE